MAGPRSSPRSGRQLHVIALAVMAMAVCVAGLRPVGARGALALRRVAALRAATACSGWGGSSSRVCMSSSSLSEGVDTAPYLTFLKETASAPNPPRRLETVLRLLRHRGMTLTPDVAAERKGLHPFFIPLATDVDGSKVGLLRWPTAPEHLPMPLVRSNAAAGGASVGAGLSLVATDTEHWIKRVASEEDFKESPAAAEVVALANADLQSNQEPYVAGSVKKLGYGVERYQMLKVANSAFPDVFQWLVESHLAKGDMISALSTAEKFNEVFLGWGHPYAYYAQVLSSQNGREAEARDAAKVALRCPCWTITRDAAELERVCSIAGYADMAEVKSLYRGMAEDTQEGKKTEGKAPAQIALDRAAHMMDAVMFGHGDWDSVRADLAAMYTEAGCPELVKLVQN